MVELLLLRHAEAEPAALDGEDFQRPLTARGRDAALAAAARLTALAWHPQRLLYSPAARTTATATLIAQALKLDAHTLQEVPVPPLQTNIGFAPEPPGSKTMRHSISISLNATPTLSVTSPH